MNVIRLVNDDHWMMDILKAVKALRLPDWWICAGFVRSKIWDTLHGFRERTPLPDVDVIYFDEENTEASEEKRLEECLRIILPDIPWSVKNQARMHVVNDVTPYSSSVDAIFRFPETATALGVKLDNSDQVILAAPCGITDVIQGVVQPTCYFKETEERLAIYRQRIEKKNWAATWPGLDILDFSGGAASRILRGR